MRVIDVEKLKVALNGKISAEDETAIIESIMNESFEHDEEGVQARIDDAVKTAREEEARVYGEKIHNMFFGGGAGESASGGEVVDDSKVDVKETKPVVEDIFEEV